jgi:hypothetical protein
MFANRLTPCVHRRSSPVRRSVWRLGVGIAICMPTSYRRVDSDVGRGCWGLVRDLSEPKILRQKLQKLPGWNRIHVYK